MFESFVNFLKENNFSIIPVKIVVPIVTFFIGAIVAKVVSSLIFRLFKELEVNTLLQKATKKKFDFALLISRIIKYTIYLIFVVIILNELGITSIILYIIVGFLLLVILVTFFLGAKDFIPNLFAGIFVLKNREIKVGDTIKCGDISGTVESTGLIETKLRTQKGEHIFVPNSSLIRKSLIITKGAKDKRKK